MILNNVTLTGRIESNFSFDHEYQRYNFYRFYVEVKRASNVIDTIPVITSDKLINPGENHINDYVQIKGEYRSFNFKDNNKIRLLLYVYPLELCILDYGDYENDIFLQGNLCKEPVYRITPVGRKITDLLIAVNRDRGKTDYIPCILWGKNAYEASKLHTGDTIRIAGRIQSRLYEKDARIHTAYEVSGNLFEVINKQALTTL